MFYQIVSDTITLYNVCAVPWGMFNTVADIMINVGDILSTVGVILSTVGDVMMHLGGYLEYRGGVQYRGGKSFVI